MKISVLGSSGMLGWMVSEYLYRNRNNYSDLIFTIRNPLKLDYFQKKWPEAKIKLFDVLFSIGEKNIGTTIENSEYVVNCIGITNKQIDETDFVSTEVASLVNTYYPRWLNIEAEKSGSKVIHITTDCVFSGKRGNYDEFDIHDAEDVYGKTKSDGEQKSKNARWIRCSILGPEIDTCDSLLQWFLSRQQNEHIQGYFNHIWNGVTTLAFAKLCHTIFTHKLVLPSIHHFIPSGTIQKVNLLLIMAELYGREDIVIEPVITEKEINRTLVTKNIGLNEILWGKMGYSETPTIPILIKEMRDFYI